jgi:cobalt-zinc-cadmium efflux system membrane fusion protein
MNLTIIIAFFLFTALLAGCRKAGESKESGDPKVEGQTLTFPTNSPQLGMLAVAAAAESKAPAVRFPGRVVWDDNVTTRVYTPLSGRVTKVLADVRSEVSSNAPLALIASPDFGQAQADASRAASDFVLAERTFNRLRELAAHGAAAQKDVQSAEADFERARSEKERAEVRLKLYGDAAGGVDQLYRLTSPLGGMVVERNLNPGQEVRADQMLANSEKLVAPLFVITDPSRVWVLVDVAEQDLPLFKPGLEVVVRSRAFADEVFRGKVELVSDQIDPATRMVRVRAAVENPQRRLKAEMLVSVELSPASTTGLEVPAKAVFLKGEQHFVFREEGRGKFSRQPVKIGPERDGQMLILDGLKPGERVVSDGCLLLEQVLAAE